MRKNEAEFRANNPEITRRYYLNSINKFPAVDGIKKCATCKTNKEVERFHRNQSAADGYVHVCKDCRRVNYTKPSNRAKANKRRRGDKKLQAYGRRRLLKKNYGITTEQYQEMLARQNGGCGICSATRADSRGHRLIVDHCHKTNRIRGLLCSNCNFAIGLFKDDFKLIARSMAYLAGLYRLDRHS